MNASSLFGPYWAHILIFNVLIIAFLFIATHMDAIFSGDGPGYSARRHFESGQAADMKADDATAPEHYVKAVEE